MNHLFKLGGMASLFQSALYLIAVLAVSMVPAEQITGTTAQFAESYASHPVPLVTMSIAFVLLGFLGFTLVAPATAALFQKKDSGWVLFGRNTALLSLAVVTVYYGWFLGTMPVRLLAYQSGTLLLHPQAPMNWVGWFMFGGMGVWVALVGVLAWIHGVLPKGFTVVCAIKAGGFWLILAGIILGDLAVSTLGAFIGGVLGGATYHLWLGIALLRTSRLP